MSFVSLRYINSNFGKSMSRVMNNTLNFENCSNTYAYGTTDPTGPGISSRGILYFDNIVLDRLIDYIKSNATLKSFSIDEMNVYRYRPKRLSLDTYGVVDYWWLILAINQIPSVLKFNNFSYLLMPDQATTETAINEELFANPITTTPVQ